MSIPDYQTLMLPLLTLAGDGREHVFREAVDKLADQFGLDEKSRSELLPSGTYPVFASRVGWARTYMKQAGLIEAPKRGILRISKVGVELLATKPARIDNKILERYDAFREFKQRGRDSSTDESVRTLEIPEPSANELTPEESMEAAYKRLRSSLESELLDRIKTVSPSFFERLVVDLLVAMGYGGSRSDAGRAIGKSGDGGIDGIINEDRLGLDVIYLQAKRWEGTVGRPEIQKFAGALQGQRASKGVFITTSSFTKDAIEYANVITSKIILIDGERLASLMIEHDVAVGRVGSYVLKRIDNDYFDAT
ncbi:MAG: restriction endonuclease [Nevskia sp.]|nr:restriction endonuclease [Nevskia sp.]